MTGNNQPPLIKLHNLANLTFIGNVELMTIYKVICLDIALKIHKTMCFSVQTCNAKLGNKISYTRPRAK